MRSQIITGASLSVCRVRDSYFPVKSPFRIKQHRTNEYNSLFLLFYLTTSPGNPKPELQWLQDDKPVTEGAYIMTLIHDITDREYHGCLQLDSPTHLNNGNYTLIAKNKFGTDHKVVEAHFMHQPWEGEERRSEMHNIRLFKSVQGCMIAF